MKLDRILFVVIALLAAIIVANPAAAKVTADPYGFTAALEQNDTLDAALTLSNTGDATVNFTVEMAEAGGNRQMAHRGGPRRDSCRSRDRPKGRSA